VIDNWGNRYYVGSGGVFSLGGFLPFQVGHEGRYKPGESALALLTIEQRELQDDLREFHVYLYKCCGSRRARRRYFAIQRPTERQRNLFEDLPDPNPAELRVTIGAGLEPPQPARRRK
jgi:hypothetical protein